MQKISAKNLRIKDNILLLQHSKKQNRKFTVRITILQTDIEWAQPEKNMAVAGKFISGNDNKTALYVLPEMWTTGFVMNPECCVNEVNTCATLEWIRGQASDNNCAICGSVAVKTGNKEYRNRQYFVRPDGTYEYYDKHHLFTYGGENISYTPGNKRIIAEYMGIRFLLQTCYDLRFPVWMRNRNDYDAIIVTANWPAKRQDVWQILLRARAIENQCYVIGANRIGTDPSCSYKGNSAIIDAKGRTMVQANADKQQSITADIDVNGLHGFRAKFPVLNDRDIF